MEAARLEVTDDDSVRANTQSAAELHICNAVWIDRETLDWCDPQGDSKEEISFSCEIEYILNYYEAVNQLSVTSKQQEVVVRINFMLIAACVLNLGKTTPNSEGETAEINQTKLKSWCWLKEKTDELRKQKKKK